MRAACCGGSLASIAVWPACSQCWSWGHIFIIDILIACGSFAPGSPSGELCGAQLRRAVATLEVLKALSHLEGIPASVIALSAEPLTHSQCYPILPGGGGAGRSATSFEGSGRDEKAIRNTCCMSSCALRSVPSCVVFRSRSTLSSRAFPAPSVLPASSFSSRSCQLARPAMPRRATSILRSTPGRASSTAWSSIWSHSMTEAWLWRAFSTGSTAW